MNVFSAVAQALGFGAEDKKPAPPPGDDFWYEAAGQNNSAGIQVTPDIALKASAVFACVKVLAETIATLPLRMHREGPSGRVDAPEHPLDELIRFQPNRRQTAVEFWEQMILHSAMRGGAYAEILPGRRGAVDQLVPLHTDRVRPEQVADGTLRFRVSSTTGAPERILLQEEVFRIPGMSSDGINGLRAVDLASEAIGLGMAADQYAARVFSNKLNIGGYLIHKGQLSETGQKNLINALMQRFAGAQNSHRPVVLQEDMKFEKASMDADKAQLLEARKWQISEVARYWRIPLHMLGIDDQTNRSTVEAQGINFVKYSLRPWCKRIEQAIRRDLIIATNLYVAKFNMEGLQRGDSAARGEYFAKALGSGGGDGWMTQNEVRKVEGLNAHPDGDRLPSRIIDATPSGQTREEARSVRDGQIALTDQTAMSGPQRLIAKEAAAIRKAAMRFADNRDAFDAWLTSFYGGHVSSVMETLNVPKDVARAYCAHQRETAIATTVIEPMLEQWQDDLPGEIAATLEAHTTEEGPPQ